MEVRHETERPLLTKRNENFCKCIYISINNIDQKFSFTFGSHYNRNENVLISIMLTISLSTKVLRFTFARKDEAAGNSEPPQGLPASKPVGGSGLSARESQMPHSVGTSMCLVRISLLRGPKVRKELPALAAQLRAFSSLLSLPSRAQSVSHKSLP